MTNKVPPTGKKRGRKPKEKIKIPEEYFQKKKFTEGDENVILTLPFLVMMLPVC